jgi:hypothetical protein
MWMIVAAIDVAFVLAVIMAFRWSERRRKRRLQEVLDERRSIGDDDNVA